MFRSALKEINAEFSAEEKYLDSIQRTVHDSCIAAGMSRRETSSVLLATEEAATNIIRHAYLYEKGVLRLRIVLYKKLVVFSLIDFGRSFQPNSTGTIDLAKLVESGRKGGLGFYMIQKIMDSVEYISAAGRNELRMIKRLHRSGGDGRGLLRRMFTLRAKFSVWTFIIVLVIVGGAFYYMDRQTTQQLYARLHRTVNSLTRTIADQAAGYMVRSRSDIEFAELVASYARANPELRRVVLADAGGVIIAHSDSTRLIRTPYRAPESIGPVVVGEPASLEIDGERVYYLVQPITWGSTKVGQAYVTYTSETISGPLTDARRRVLFLTLLLLLFGVFGIYMLSNYFVRPIVKITSRVRRFASGDLESELPLEGAEEFFEISRAFNEVMTRLSQDKKNIAAREKMAKEIEVASQIQHTLLPRKLPEPEGLRLGAFYRPATVVGGDLYDVFEVGPEKYCLVVADVSGKGVPASLVMSMLRTVIRIYSADAVSPKGLLTRVNRYLDGNIPSGMFITVMLAIYDAAERNLGLVSAGHNPLLLCSRDAKAVHRVNPAGMPLGMPVVLKGGFEESLEEINLSLADGDLLLMYTDGVTEATDREGRQFGLDRLVTFMETNNRGIAVKLPDLTANLIAELDEFAGFSKLGDDITFIVARVGVAVETAGAGKPGQIESIPVGQENALTDKKSL